jgi:hypothetical protein
MKIKFKLSLMMIAIVVVVAGEHRSNSTTAGDHYEPESGPGETLVPDHRAI